MEDRTLLKRKLSWRSFKGTIQVLISTTVVEVGIHVPNAVIMVWKTLSDSAWLYSPTARQSRRKQAVCILVSDVRDETGLARLNALVNSNDGLKLLKGFGIKRPGVYGLSAWAHSFQQPIA